jgi:hypothetical protein
LDKEVEIEEKKSSDCLFGDALFENLKDWFEVVEFGCWEELTDDCGVCWDWKSFELLDWEDVIVLKKETCN